MGRAFHAAAVQPAVTYKPLCSLHLPAPFDLGMHAPSISGAFFNYARHIAPVGDSSDEKPRDFLTHVVKVIPSGSALELTGAMDRFWAKLLTNGSAFETRLAGFSRAVWYPTVPPWRQCASTERISPDLMP